MGFKIVKLSIIKKKIPLCADKIRKSGQLLVKDGGVYCIDAENFKNQWGEHEAWNGNLKHNLVVNQVADKKGSNNVVVLKIPTSKINCDKLKARAEEDFFYSYNMREVERGSLFGVERPDCVSNRYDWATAKENFSDNKSLEYIITEPVDFDDVEIIYSGNIKNENIDDVVDVIYKEADKNKE